jgi:biopolymer transport protein ExbD
MKKRTIIELTPFVDILLILLFAFLFNISETNEKAEVATNKSIELAQENLELKNDLEEKSNSLQEIANQNDKLEKQNTFYENFYIELSNIIEKAFEDVELPENIDEDEVERIKKLLENKEINLDYFIKAEALKENFFVLDITIQGEEPEIFLNNQKIDFSITYEQYASESTRESKLNILEEKIESSLKNNGIPQLVLITIKQMDDNVFLYSYNLLLEAVKEIQNKYGADRIYFTEIPFLYNN